MTYRILRQLSAAVLVLTAAACGPSDSPKESTKIGEAAETTAAPLPANAPKAIVSLSATATETLFAIGAGKQVIAVDDQSNFPAEAPKTDLSGYKPNVEAIAGKKPDLVIISGDSAKLTESLGKLGIAVLDQPAAKTIDEAYAEIIALGEKTGHADGAAKVVADMKQRIEFAVRQVPKAERSYYHELDDTFYSVTSKTFIGSVYSLFGLKNIADTADKDGSGYPQLSAEYIAKSNPDLIFLADTKCCKQGPEAVAARPGWADLAAVKTNAVLGLDDDIASRWGPRLADLVELISRKLVALPVVAKAA